MKNPTEIFDAAVQQPLLGQVALTLAQTVAILDHYQKQGDDPLAREQAADLVEVVVLLTAILNRNVPS